MCIVASYGLLLCFLFHLSTIISVVFFWMKQKHTEPTTNTLRHLNIACWNSATDLILFCNQPENGMREARAGEDGNAKALCHGKCNLNTSYPKTRNTPVIFVIPLMCLCFVCRFMFPMSAFIY